MRYTMQKIDGAYVSVATLPARETATTIASVPTMPAYLRWDPVDFDGNLLSTDDTLQEVFAKFDSLSPSGFILVGKTVFVDSVHGDDSSGLRERFDLPFLTLMAARTAALAGDTVVVRPGVYVLPDQNHQLGKDQVDWHFQPGTTVKIAPTFLSGTNNTQKLIMTGFFDDSNSGTGLNGPLRCKVTGAADFVFDLTNCSFASQGHRSMILATDPDSEIRIDCHSISLVGLGNKYVYNVAASAGILDVNAEVIDREDPYALGWWQNGDFYLNADRLIGSKLQAELTAGTMTGSWWVTAENIAGDIEVTGTNTGARLWITAKQITGATYLNSGKTYIVAEKMLQADDFLHANYAVSTFDTAELWLTVQKITCQTLDSDNPIPGWLSLSGTKSFIDVQEFEDLGVGNTSINSQESSDSFSGGAIFVGAGEHVVAVRRTKVGSLFQYNGPVVAMTGGTLRWSGRIHNTISDAAIVGFLVDGGTLTLGNTEIVLSHASNVSVDAGSARNVYVYGTTVTNRAKGSNVTLKGNTSGFVVSSDVV
jgi:hypothetical protein